MLPYGSYLIIIIVRDEYILQVGPQALLVSIRKRFWPKGQNRKGRYFKIKKLFVCFATKAFHLEVVSDFSSECFLACLRRFDVEAR